MAFGAPYPAHYFVVPENERDQRISMPNKDFCIVDNNAFYLRGRFLIPIIRGEGRGGGGGPKEKEESFFSWDAWVSQSQANYQLALDHMDLPNRETLDPPTYGYLSTELGQAFDGQSTFNLPTQVNTEPMGFAPTFELEPDCQHPLAVNQRNGITMDQVSEIVCRLMKQGE